jgi:hydroxylamine reductase (hybrid-cluster protein)
MQPVSIADRSQPSLPAICLSFLLVGAAAPACAQGVQRCESADGKVTYSNTRCPAGTSAVRQVNTSPPVAVDEQKAAKERAKKDAADAKAIDKAREQEQAKVERAALEKNKQQDKQQAKERERCERAKRDLEDARTARATLLEERAATIEQMHKADREIAKHEADAAKACPAS